ncbi:MAG: disulfide bond formation protein B [Gammaproteobacteria bacterium]
MLSTRTIFLGLFLACASLLGFGLYLQHMKGIEPCPLCILQRIAYITIAITALIATIHGPGHLFQRIYGSLITLTALAGGGIATRQVWLQHLPPDQVPECGPGLEYMMEFLPIGEILDLIFTGSGECAEVLWTFLGFSIPQWSLVCFTCLTIVGVILIFKKTE